MSGGLWVTSYVLIWTTVVGLSVLVVAERLAPAPPVPGADYGAHSMTLVAFSSPACQVCRQLFPSLRAMTRQYRDVALVEIELSAQSQPVFAAFGVLSTPYVVTVDWAGTVRGQGVANSLEQVEVLVEEGLADA